MFIILKHNSSAYLWQSFKSYINHTSINMIVPDWWNNKSKKILDRIGWLLARSSMKVFWKFFYHLEGAYYIKEINKMLFNGEIPAECCKDTYFYIWKEHPHELFCHLQLANHFSHFCMSRQAQSIMKNTKSSVKEQAKYQKTYWSTHFQV